MAGLVKKAQEMGDQMNKVGEELRHRRVTGAAGGGMVELEMTGDYKAIRCKIDPQVAGDHELLEDLVVAAMNQALEKATNLRSELMKEKTFGLPLGDIHDMLVKSGAIPVEEVSRRTSNDPLEKK